MCKILKIGKFKTSNFQKIQRLKKILEFTTMASDSAKLFIVLITFIVISSSEGFHCKDNPHGFYPTPNNCVYFTECKGGKSEGWVCLADLLYNPNISRCAWPDVDWYTEYPIPTNCLQTHPNALIASRVRDDCKSYIQCSDGQQFNCPGETRFNPERRGCDSPSGFRCTETDTDN